MTNWNSGDDPERPPEVSAKAPRGWRWDRPDRRWKPKLRGPILFRLGTQVDESPATQWPSELDPTSTSAVEVVDQAGRDLDRAHESLYYAARRYCATTEQNFLQMASRIPPGHLPPFVGVGNAAEDLAEAGQRYMGAFARWERLYFSGPKPDNKWTQRIGGRERSTFTQQ